MLKIERQKNLDAAFAFMHVRDERIRDSEKARDSVCKGSGLSGLLFHDLRRTGVRNLVRTGAAERVARVISGHKTLAVFERYNIVSGRNLRMEFASWKLTSRRRKIRRESKFLPLRSQEQRGS